GTAPVAGRDPLQFLGFLDGFVDGANHVERLLRQVIVLTGQDAGETTDGLLQRHVLAGGTGEHFGHVERLRQEALDLTGAGHQLLVGLGQLVHTQDGDDVLQFLVALQHVLHAARGVVVLLAHHQRVQRTAGGVQRVHGRVDTQGGDVAGQYDGGVEVGEGGRRARVGQVVRGNVDGLHGGDRAYLGGGDALLQNTHFLGQGRLIAHGGRHTAQQRGHFGTGQGVAVDVVDEQQNVAAFVTELLGHGQAGQGDAQTVARRLVHLTVHHRDLVQDVGVLHLVVEVVPFTGPLAHAGEHGQTAVRLGDVVDQLHHVHGLADAGATEQADLSALGERADQVDHLDAGFQQLVAARLIGVARRGAVDAPVLGGVDRTGFVDGLAQDVHDAAQGARADRNGDGGAGVGHVQATLEAFGGTHGDGTDDAVAQLLLDFQGGCRALYLQRVIDVRHLIAWKFHVDDGADDLNDTSTTHVWFL